jgi:hypothetical protein
MKSSKGGSRLALIRFCTVGLLMVVEQVNSVVAVLAVKAIFIVSLMLIYLFFINLFISLHKSASGLCN